MIGKLTCCLILWAGAMILTYSERELIPKIRIVFTH